MRKATTRRAVLSQAMTLAIVAVAVLPTEAPRRAARTCGWRR
jgi:hypothetical protein